ncbi:hypothetical protein VNO80_16491 [Phaseolus coccineus]|uniref:Uncharacterized protein n=1 Tax=Phaseolus coccineus TaxID=3886 RepID=A0AAN9MRS5_PHACN
MAGRKSYLEASYGCAKNMKETGTLLVKSVTSEKKDISRKPSSIHHKRSASVQADIDPASGVALHTTYRARKPIALGRALAGRGWEVVRPVHQEVGTVENKVANGCVMRGNLPNSSGPILKKAKKRCLMNLRSISHLSLSSTTSNLAYPRRPALRMMSSPVLE